MPGERGRQTRREDGKPYAGGPGRLTHAERVIDPASGLTKGDLARYYTQAAPLMRPYLKGRPVSLVRAPSGIGGPVFPAPHGCRDARRASVAGVPVSGASALAGAADAEGGAGGSPDECHRIPHLERREDDHRQAGPHRVRPGPGRGRALGERQAGGPGAARVVERDRAGRVAQDQRRQGPACAGAAAQAAWLGNHEGFFSGPGAASGAGLAAVVRGQERSAQPGGQDLRGLPAQRLWRDDRGALVGAGAAGPADLGADQLGRTGAGARRRALDHRGRAGAIGYRQSSLDGYAPQALGKAMAALGSRPS